MIEVRLPPRLDDSRQAWDAAHALGQQVHACWPTLTGVKVRVHRNRTRLITWSRRSGALHLGVHLAFLPHPADVLAVMAERDDGAWQRLLALPREGTPAPVLATEGHVHDLEHLLATERQRVDLAALEAPTVGWGRWPGVPPRRSLRLGSCLAGPPAVVRIHPVLDHREVPDWFVGFVLYHELLHLRFPPLTDGRRRVVHPRSFRMAERRHPRWAEAEAWERAHVGALLQRVRARVQRARRQ